MAELVEVIDYPLLQSLPGNTVVGQQLVGSSGSKISRQGHVQCRRDTASSSGHTVARTRSHS